LDEEIAATGAFILRGPEAGGLFVKLEDRPLKKQKY